MLYLLIVSVIWGCSFGLIKTYLAGLESSFIAAVRIALALLVFLPFLRLKDLKLSQLAALMSIGAIQFGLMYLTYIYAFQFLQAYQVALFTIFTPLYVTLINDLMNRKVRLLFLSTSLLAVAGSIVIVFREIGRQELHIGFILIQLSNLCFAFGQLAYTRWKSKHKNLSDKGIFALLYMGAITLTLPTALIVADWSTLQLSINAIVTLLYLGVIASGLGFFIWNFGAQKTNIGALAILNNVKIPLGIGFALFVFHEQASLWRLFVGGGIIALSLIINEWYKSA
jgi:drug/metabolite transporter (DMT)-like permease